MKKILLMILIILAAVTLGGCNDDKELADNVSGTITLTPEIAKQVSGKETLFIIMRGPVGAPYAVKVVPQPKFPLQYTIGTEDRMSAETKFVGGVSISVRLDRDSKIGELEKGDYIGKAKKAPVVMGTNGVDVVIDTPGEMSLDGQ